MNHTRIEADSRRQELVEKWERTVGWFLLLTCFNVFFALCLPLITTDCKASLKYALKGKPLPLLTEWVCQCPWWPWVCVAACVAGIVLSLQREPKDNMPWNLLIVILTVELVVMFLSVVAFCLPLVRLGVS